MNPTASKLPLLEACPTAGALDSVWTESTDDQVAGTERHRFFQRCGEIGIQDALAAIPGDAPWRAQCEALSVHAPYIPRGVYELAYALDVNTGTARCLGAYLDRAYDVSPTEVSGTADLTCSPTAERPTWLVVDFKGDEAVEPASENVQLAFYALCVARIHGLTEVDVAIAYLRRDGTIYWDTATLDMLDLAAVEYRIGRIVARVMAARAARERGDALDYGMGYHCRRCPSLPLCPARVATARALLGEDLSVERMAMLTDEQAGKAYVQIKTSIELLERAKESLTERGKARGFPLPGGSIMRPIDVTERALVFDKAVAYLKTRFGDQVEKAIKRTLAIGAVVELARQIAPGKGHKKATDELFAALAAVGGLRVSKHVELREKKPSKAKGGKGAAEVESDDGGEEFVDG